MTGGTGTLDRRRFIAAAGTFAGAAFMPRVLAAAPLPKSLAVVVPFGDGSTVATCIQLLATGVAASIGGRVLIDFPEQPNLMRNALARVATPSGADLAILATDLLAQATWDVTDPSAAALDTLTPIATLTPGYSTTLFVGASSPIRKWADFAAESGTTTLSLSTPNPGSVHLRFLETALATTFVDRTATSRAGLYGAVTDGSCAAGLVNTLSFLAFSAANPGQLRPVITFGGARNAVLGVPTLREVTGNRRLATTNMVAVLGAADLDSSVAAKLYLAFARAAKLPAVRTASRKIGFPLSVEGPDAVRVAIARDRKVVATAARQGT